MPTTRRIPIFLCAIQSLDHGSLDPSCTLVDKEGEVEGIIHREVMEQHVNTIQSGTVLLLSNVVVLLTQAGLNIYPFVGKSVPGKFTN